MPKLPMSLTLEEANIVWLKGVTERSGARSVSETVDRLITAARERGSDGARSARSVVGTIDLAPEDTTLERADQAIRDLFAQSLARPTSVKEARAGYSPKRRRNG